MPIEGREGNSRGKETEARVAAVLTSLPYVHEVLFSEEHAPDIDLQVILTPDENRFPFSLVYVQVKSSNQHIYDYRKEKGPDLAQFEHRLTSKEIDKVRTDYFASKHTIILNGGVKYDKKKKSKRLVTEETIARRFDTQIRYIAEYHTAQSVMIFPGEEDS